MAEINKLSLEDVSQKKNCNLCNEIVFDIGKNTGYGVIIYKIGDKKNGWFATLSPKTGGDPNFDFTIQLMPFYHLTHFSQMAAYPKLSENYGTIFAKISKAMASIMMSDQNLKSTAKARKNAVSIATYGKSTTWKEKKEHLHIKIFPFRGDIGQPYTVDSSFGKKEVHKKDGKSFVMMNPVIKKKIPDKRFKDLTKNLLLLLNE